MYSYKGINGKKYKMILEKSTGKTVLAPMGTYTLFPVISDGTIHYDLSAGDTVICDTCKSKTNIKFPTDFEDEDGRRSTTYWCTKCGAKERRNDLGIIYRKEGRK